MEIHQIRNATIIVTYADKKFLIDPWLGPKDYMPGFEGAYNSEVKQPRVDLPMSVGDIVNKIDAVILTHFHPDHWDKFAGEALRKDIPFFVQSDCDAKIIRGSGFVDVRILSSNKTLFGEVSLYKTKCQHGRKEIVEPIYKAMGMPYDSMGIVFKANSEKTLYIAGDTIWCDEVKNAIDSNLPEVIVINSCGARLLNGERIIMDLEDVKSISEYAPQAVIIASHMDTVSHLTVTRNDIKKAAFKNVIVPEDNEKVTY